jgi:hypothetical protein
MSNSHFLIDGRSRALVGAAKKIESLRLSILEAVNAEYAQQLAKAGPLRRLWLRSAIVREVNTRLAAEIETFAPSDGLY